MLVDFLKKHSRAISIYHWLSFLFVLIIWRFQWRILPLVGTGFVFSAIEFLWDKYMLRDGKFPSGKELSLLIYEIYILLFSLMGLITPKSPVVLNCILIPWHETTIYCAKKYNIDGNWFKKKDEEESIFDKKGER